MSKKIIFLAIGFILILISLSLAIFFYSKYQSALKVLKDPKESAKLESKLLVEKIGKLMELPQGEEPTVATVSDKDKLGSQPFFAKAQNGDKVLIYTKAKKAILFRPSTNKVIEVGPVTIGELASPTASPSAKPSIQITTPTPTLQVAVKLAIYNASQMTGLAASTEAKLKNQFNNIRIVEKANSQEDYDKNLVIDLSGKQKSLATDIAQFLGGEVGQFPTSEVKPAADILIIVVE